MAAHEIAKMLDPVDIGDCGSNQYALHIILFFYDPVHLYITRHNVTRPHHPDGQITCAKFNKRLILQNNEKVRIVNSAES